ncbi:MAG: C-terminal helicase domain-containing protein, partial [Candidatus Fonsibacter sp.]
MKFNVNYEYVLSQINDTELIITDQSINESYTVPIKYIKANFIHGYCRTCHSLQGSSISREITIFDWELFYTSRKWIYTAATRATDLNQVFLYNGKSEVMNE